MAHLSLLGRRVRLEVLQAHLVSSGRSGLAMPAESLQNTKHGEIPVSGPAETMNGRLRGNEDEGEDENENEAGG